MHNKNLRMAPLTLPSPPRGGEGVGGAILQKIFIFIFISNFKILFIL